MKLSMGVGGAIFVVPPAMEVEISIFSKRNQKEVIDSAVKMMEAPPSSPSRVSVPYSDEGDVLMEVLCCPWHRRHLCVHRCQIVIPLKLFERGSENLTFPSDVSLSASKAGVDFLTTKKKRKGSDSSILVVGRYDLRSRALR